MSNKVILVSLDSSDRTSGTVNDYTITNDGNMFPINPISVKPMITILPYSWYNVLAGQNNMFQFTETGGGTHLITIADGNYDGPQLASTLQAAIIASVTIHPFTVVYNVSTNLFTISSSGGGSFTMDFTIANNLSGLLGFVNGAIYAPAQASWTSVTTPTLTSDKVVRIHCSLVSGKDTGILPFTATTATNPQIIMEFPIVGAFNDIMTYYPSRSTSAYSITESAFVNSGYTQPHSIRMWLSFPSGFPLDLRGQSWHTTLAFGF